MSKTFLKITAWGLLLGVGGWFLFDNSTSFREMMYSYIENGELLTLEARFSADQIIKIHQRELLPDGQYTFQEPLLKFYPYLLMEVKYILQTGKTREGVMLWSLVDGEMVMDTETWEKTHGFQDAINAGANRSDFLVMNTLAQYRGALPLSRLQRELNLEEEEFERIIEGARKKFLIIIKGNEAALHFQEPRFLVAPETRIHQSLVTKPYDHAQTIVKRYSRKQIEQTARAAFGNDFAVRDTKIVFLPVYSIGVLNPDGSVLTSYWNALNGNRVDR